MIEKQYAPLPERYQNIPYRKCGVSSLRLPEISLGLWHNFGSFDPYERGRDMVYFAFDNGVNHFDLANNYGPIPGSAEENFGRILRDGLAPYRDEIIVSTKAGHPMWEGTNGGNSSRKHLIASLDQSLRRMGLEYVDIFYTHRYDGETPIEETAQALIDIVRHGKALYIGISKYPADKASQIYQLLRSANVPCLISQYRYSLFEREIEKEIIPLANSVGSGVIAFSPLAQGLLTDRYLHGIPEGSRAASSSIFLTRESLTESRVAQIKALNEIAASRGEKLSQMALAWALKDPRMSSLIIGASSTQQIAENLKATSAAPFTEEQLQKIDAITLQ